ncbi:hypothetical protein Rctr41k_02 [Virus Rctr41k]|nr:hypothetical protein Rctr41k_02 [Virus Rctr41k]
MEGNSSKAFLHTREAAAWVPLMQSAITSLLVTVAFSAVLIALDVRRWWGWAVAVGVVTLILMWWRLLNHWFKLTAHLEQLTGLDLNMNGRVDEPEDEPEPQTVKVQLSRVSESGSWSGEYFDLPGSLGDLKTLAQGLLDGRPFTEREWTGRGKPYASEAFRSLRRELLRRGLIELASTKDARQGYVLTDEGTAFMLNLVEGS